MVAAARLAWLHAQVCEGVSVSVHITCAAGQDKVRFILGKSTSSSQPSWLVLSAINMVSLGCNGAVVVDRGHKLSSGLSEICFWIKRTPFAFSADAVAYVPGKVLVTAFAASRAGEKCTTAGTDVPSGTHKSSESQSLHSNPVPLAFVNELDDSFVAVCSGPDLAVDGLVAGAPRECDSSVTRSTVLDPTSVLPALPSTSSSTVFGIGSAVWIHGLISRPELNSCMGTIVEALADDGRYGVRVEGSSLFGRRSADVRIRSANVRGTLFQAEKT